MADSVKFKFIFSEKCLFLHSILSNDQEEQKHEV